MKQEFKSVVMAAAERKAEQLELEFSFEGYQVVRRELFAHINDPVTISELWEEIKGDMPEGFAKGKLQYAMTRMWKEEFGRNEGKVNTYFLAK